VLIPAVILGPLLLAVFLLSIPVDLAFFFESGKVSRSRIRIGWLFGLIGQDLGGAKSGREKKPEEMKAKKRRMTFRAALVAFNARGFAAGVLLLGRRLLSSVQVRKVDIDIQVGTGEPAETGLLFGLIRPSVALAQPGFSSNIRIEPNFFEETFEGHAMGTVRVYPIKLIPPLIAFVLSPATFRGVRALRRARTA
jgi:hypothetical protein